VSSDAIAERVAFHESGHCVVAVRLGLSLHSARLTPAEVRTDYRLNAVPGKPIDERALFYLAGLFAEYRFDPVATQVANSDIDFEEAVRLLGDNATTISRVKPLMQRAAGIVNANWREIEIVAHDLRRCGSLSGARIRRLL
jgi:hypothetical protein